MTIKAWGQGSLAMSEIQAEFGGGNPIGLNEYHAGESYVPAGTRGSFGVIPASGAIAIRHFYGSSDYSPGSRTYTSGTHNLTLNQGAQYLYVQMAGGGGGAAYQGNGYTHHSSGGGGGHYFYARVNVANGYRIVVNVGGGGAPDASYSGGSGQTGGTGGLSRVRVYNASNALILTLTSNGGAGGFAHHNYGTAGAGGAGSVSGSATIYNNNGGAAGTSVHKGGGWASGGGCSYPGSIGNGGGMSGQNPLAGTRGEVKVWW